MVERDEVIANTVIVPEPLGRVKSKSGQFNKETKAIF